MTTLYFCEILIFLLIVILSPPLPWPFTLSLPHPHPYGTLPSFLCLPPKTSCKHCKLPKQIWAECGCQMAFVHNTAIKSNFTKYFTNTDRFYLCSAFYTSTYSPCPSATLFLPSHALTPKFQLQGLGILHAKWLVMLQASKYSLIYLCFTGIGRVYYIHL